MSQRRGFTLIELLVVVGIIGLLIAIALPVIDRVQHAAYATQCLTNMRNMQQAQYSYMADQNGRFVEAGLDHGGVEYDDTIPWIESLRQYGTDIVARSPLDDSPYWGPDGQQMNGRHRVTSYGINNFLSPHEETAPNLTGFPISRLHQVPQPAATVQFLVMAYEGDFAVSDHPHAEGWRNPNHAAREVEISHRDGPDVAYESVSHYGFLDGSARMRAFKEVFRDETDNNFHPRLAR